MAVSVPLEVVILPILIPLVVTPAPVVAGGGYWNQAVWNTGGGYQQFPSALFPDYHFQSYGGLGFSSVPRELGGQMSSERSRFSGAQNS